MKKTITILLSLVFFITLSACSKSWNNPNNHTSTKEVLYYSSFSQSPKTLDPARSYSSDEALFVAQIYEPPLQYDYLKRPYTLIPLTATKVPEPIYLDKNGKQLPANASVKQIAYSVYNIEIKPGIYYQDHPAFAKDDNGNYLYLNLSTKDVAKIHNLDDFTKTDTRELTAADYVYQIKRLASLKTQSPILTLMSDYIVGLKEYAENLQNIYQKQIKDNKNDLYLDLNKYDFSGVKVINRYQYQIILKGKYPQFSFWLAMPFFSPMPWEADKFYAQNGMEQKNITLDWYPIGTGAYYLSENNPNRHMILSRNKNYHGEYYPSQGSEQDKQKGLLQFANKPIPFIDKYIFTLEKESIPRWTKFLQGYYDQSAISSDNFDQAVKVDSQGNLVLTQKMRKRDLRLSASVSPGIFYMGFNMLDDVVGGYSPQAIKLRQAISITFNYEEYISIFLNGRGIVAQEPIPPGIFGYVDGNAGINPYLFDIKNGKAIKKPLVYAKQLLTEAGYPNGINKKTGQQLILHLDVPGTGNPDEMSQFEWIRKQFAKLGISLEVRSTTYNRFQEKMRTGNAQLYMWGWSADYPDPENFLFLLYGPNSKVKTGGENASNYQNQKFDKLFEQMKNMPNTPERANIIKQMLAIIENDSPWIWGYYPEDFALQQQWVYPTKPSGIINNALKYLNLNANLRAQKQKEWNHPIIWPIFIFILIMIIGLLPVVIQYWRKEHKPMKRVNRNNT